MNLVSIIMQMLTPELLGKLAAGIGADPALVQKAASAGIPAILAGLAGASGQPGGGSLITNAISKLDPGMMGNLASVLGGSGQGALATTGTNILGSLLGNSALGTLAGAIGKYSGLGGTASTGLIGALVPVVLGSIGQQQRNMGLDANGVAKLLNDQKTNIQAALPGDFAKLLSGSGMLDSVIGQAGNMASKAAGTMAAGAQNAGATMSKTAAAAANDVDEDAAGGGSNWLPWVIGLVALAAIAWFLSQHVGTTPPATEPASTMAPAPAAPATTTMAPAPAAPAATTTMAAPAATTNAMTAAPKIMVGDLDAGAAISTALDSLKTALPAIKDEASAKDALPKLTDAAAALDKVNGAIASAPADLKKQLAALAAAGLTAIGPMIDTALANTAVAAIVKPVLDGIKAKLDTLSKAS